MPGPAEAGRGHFRLACPAVFASPLSCFVGTSPRNDAALSTKSLLWLREDTLKPTPEGGFSSFQGCASHDPSGIAIPHYAAIFFAGSRSVNRAGRLRSDLAPKIRRLRSPIRAIETSARYDRGKSSRETERVRRDPFSLFREIYVSELLFDLASSFPHHRSCASDPAAIRWPSEQGVAEPKKTR